MNKDRFSSYMIKEFRIVYDRPDIAVDYVAFFDSKQISKEEVEKEINNHMAQYDDRILTMTKKQWDIVFATMRGE